MNTIHRDLKTPNILIDEDGFLVLSDFGIAELRQSSATMGEQEYLIGTPEYQPPELLQQEPYSFTVDYW